MEIASVRATHFGQLINNFGPDTDSVIEILTAYPQELPQYLFIQKRVDVGFYFTVWHSVIGQDFEDFATEGNQEDWKPYQVYDLDTGTAVKFYVQTLLRFRWPFPSVAS